MKFSKAKSEGKANPLRRQAHARLRFVLGILIMFIEVLVSFEHPSAQSHGLQSWIATVVSFQKKQKVPKHWLGWTESGKEMTGKAVSCNLILIVSL